MYRRILHPHSVPPTPTVKVGQVAPSSSAEKVTCPSAADGTILFSECVLPPEQLVAVEAIDEDGERALEGLSGAIDAPASDDGVTDALASVTLSCAGL